ncbi:Bicarbonate transport system permease protein CmpB [Rubripirellula obstinata]|uniref:Bicarbonate transport system permease protein CmpB n=1 Tax=Rubripirellula obstinata TaxID=406547 RepID=A0A5B1CH72_9BACT|nr:ABC transporter permease [Rubripirellula obstinata]KAA1260538.1 Bicarbonate transport system permease protein CmpB [Rubripirellula obstinata]
MKWRRIALHFSTVTGLPILEPFIRLMAGEDPKEQLKGIAKYILVPAAAIALFLAFWSFSSRYVVANSVALPGPSQTFREGKQLFAEHFEQKRADALKVKEKRTEAILLVRDANRAEQQAAKASDSQKQILLANATKLRKRAVSAANYRPSSPPTFVDQIFNSLQTVMFGFIIATVIAVPVGILCGMSPWFNAAITPLIQIFKPVSPLAWLPLAMLVILSFSSEGEPWFPIAFLTSALTVCLCSLWPTLVNTTLGVASVDKDYLNVAKVLKLSSMQQLCKIILPASLPLMFAGMRISLGVGWMVLIAADMLAQNPGLGKFVWDEYQNNNEISFARIAFSVIIIGLIGLVLDRIMIFFRNLVSFGNPAPA